MKTLASLIVLAALSACSTPAPNKVGGEPVSTQIGRGVARFLSEPARPIPLEVSLFGVNPEDRYADQ